MFALTLKGEERLDKSHCCERMTQQVNSRWPLAESPLLGSTDQRVYWSPVFDHENIGELTVPLGVPEVIREGSDVTVVTYGACCRIAMDAAEKLAQTGIEAEIVDVQCLLPFDIHGRIGESLRKTNRILFLDEDVPGGTSAYMLQEVIEKQGGYYHLDSAPRTLSGTSHRPAYGSDGDYWSKPNPEPIFDAVYDMMHEVDPQRYLSLR